VVFCGDIDDSWLVGREMFEHAKSAIASCSDELLAIGCVAEESRSRGVLTFVSRNNIDRWHSSTHERDVLVIWQPLLCFVVCLICPSPKCHQCRKHFGRRDKNNAPARKVKVRATFSAVISRATPSTESLFPPQLHRSTQTHQPFSQANPIFEASQIRVAQLHPTFQKRSILQ